MSFAMGGSSVSGTGRLGIIAGRKSMVNQAEVAGSVILGCSASLVGWNGNVWIWMNIWDCPNKVMHADK
jgi:hypothetical protein